MARGKAWPPPRWFIKAAWRAHRRIVRASRGRKGLWPPGPGKWGALRLTTTGRRSGEPRSVIIGYYEDGPNLVSMAMNGWGAAEPAWWLNLQTDPQAVVELAGGIRREVLGRPAVGGERERMWQRWCALAKNLSGREPASHRGTPSGPQRPRRRRLKSVPPRAGGDAYAQSDVLTQRESTFDWRLGNELWSPPNETEPAAAPTGGSAGAGSTRCRGVKNGLRRA